jgi:spore coat polysaccharide biosynthesis protein SpsF
MKIYVLLQARMGSSRLPGKIMLPLADKLVIEHDIERIRKSKMINDLIVCTTTNKKDNCIAELCEKNNVKYYRGSENNVLDRYYQSAISFEKPDIIVRITSDCPLIDPNIIDDMISNYLLIMNESQYYCPKFADPNKSHTFPDGFNPEIFTFSALEEAWNNAISDYDKEHVGPYIKRHHGNLYYEIKPNKKYENLDLTLLHLSLDTPTDYKLLCNIFDNVYNKNKDFIMDDILDYLNDNCHLLN